MSLYEQIKEVTEEEQKSLGVETPANEDKNDKPEAGKEADPDRKDTDTKIRKEIKTEEKKVDEAEKAEGAEDKKPAAAAEAAPDAAAFARIRREAAAAERRAAAAEAALKQSPTQSQPGPAKVAAAVATEPDPNLDPEGHLRWQLAQTREQLKEVADWKAQQTHIEQQKTLKQNAVKAFEGYEEAFKPTVADYEDVMTYGVNAISQSIRTLNPNLKGEALGEAIQRQVLRLAAQAENQGHDPAEYLYHQAKSWGYQPKAAEAPAKEAVEEAPAKKPDLKSIAAHKKRSASSIAAGGKSGSAPLSREAVLDKSFGLNEFSKLTPSQLRELEQLEA